jgi:hypothetical protein
MDPLYVCRHTLFLLRSCSACWIYRGSECGVVDRGQTVVIKSGPRGLLMKGEAYYALCIPIAYLAIDYTIYSILQGLCLSAMLLRNAALTAECL